MMGKRLWLVVQLIWCYMHEFKINKVPIDDMIKSESLRAKKLRIEILPLKLRVAQEHWKCLVNKVEHFCLQTMIMHLQALH